MKAKSVKSSQQKKIAGGYMPTSPKMKPVMPKRNKNLRKNSKNYY